MPWVSVQAKAEASVASWFFHLLSGTHSPSTGGSSLPRGSGTRSAAWRESGPWTSWPCCWLRLRPGTCRAACLGGLPRGLVRRSLQSQHPRRPLTAPGARTACCGPAWRLGARSLLRAQHRLDDCSGCRTASSCTSRTVRTRSSRPARRRRTGAWWRATTPCTASPPRRPRRRRSGSDASGSARTRPLPTRVLLALKSWGCDGDRRSLSWVPALGPGFPRRPPSPRGAGRGRAGPGALLRAGLLRSSAAGLVFTVAALVIGVVVFCHF